LNFVSLSSLAFLSLPYVKRSNIYGNVRRDKLAEAKREDSAQQWSSGEIDAIGSIVHLSPHNEATAARHARIVQSLRKRGSPFSLPPSSESKKITERTFEPMRTDRINRYVFSFGSRVPGSSRANRVLHSLRRAALIGSFLPRWRRFCPTVPRCYGSRLIRSNALEWIS